MATTVDTLLVRIEADMSDLKRDLQRVSRSVEGQTSQMANAFRKVASAVAAIGGAYVFGNFIKSTIQTGAQVEGLKVQLDALLGSAEEGAKAFDMMAKFASKVPFSLQDIQSASGSLAAASKDAEQLGHLLQVTGNIAAQFNIPFDQAAENVQRSLSAGAASADLFQQKGVNAFMGLQAGVSYSAQETADVLIATFGHGGTADGAMAQFAETTGGVMSMFGDAVFNARKSMAESGLNDGFKELVAAVTEVIKAAQPLAVAIGQRLGAAFSALAGGIRTVSALSTEIGAILQAVGTTVVAVGGLMKAIFGPALELVFQLLAKAIDWARSNLVLLGIAAAVFTAVKLATTLYDIATAAITAARAFKVLTIAQRTYNLVAKNTIGRFLMVGTLLAAATGGLDGLAEAVAEVGRKLEQALPESLRGAVDDVTGGFSEIEDAIDEFYGRIKEDGPLKLTVSNDDALSSVNEVLAAYEEGKAKTAAELGFGGAGNANEFENELIRQRALLGIISALQNDLNEENAAGNTEAARGLRVQIEALNLQLKDAELTDRKAALQAELNVRMEEAKEAQAAYEKSLTDAASAREKAISDAAALKDEIMGQIPAYDQLKQKITQYEAVMASTNDGVLRHATANLLPKLREELRMMDPMYATLRSSVESFGQAASAAFADAIVNGRNMADALQSAFKNLIAQIIEMAFQLSVINPILNGIFKLNGNAAYPTRQLLPFGMAGGGTIQQNMPRLVGERGPELFVPSTSGTVMNNANTMRTLGGGQPVIVNQTINVETGVSQTVRAEMLSLLPRFKADTMATIVDAKRRGGSFGAAFG